MNANVAAATLSPAHDEHLATVWEAIAGRIPSETALVHGSLQRSWREFDERASRLASAVLAAGIGPGTKVAIDLYNCPEWLEVFFALIKIRAVPVNVNYRYVGRELQHLIADSQAEAIFFHASLAARIAELKEGLDKVRLYVQVEEHGSPAVTPAAGVHAYEQLIATHAPAKPIERSLEDQFLSYTGGTTGMPKGVMVNIARCFATCGFILPALGVEADLAAVPLEAAVRLAHRGERVIALPASPLMHSTGFQMTALPALTYGGTLLTLTSRSFDARELLSSIERHRVTLIAIVGDAIGRPILRALQEDAAAGRTYDLRSLKVIMSAGVAWSADTKNGLFEFMPEAVMLDACGASEGCSYGFRFYRKDDKISGTNFTPAPGLLLIDEAGEPQPCEPGRTGLLASPTTAAGYYNDPVKTARTYRTIDGVQYVVPGDYGRIEADGTLTLLGRGTTTINTGGEKVHPEEVEEVLKDFPGVDDCLVFGMPDERWGQRITALIQTQRRDLSIAALLEHVRSRLAAYKAPKEVFLVERVPRGPNGKADYPAAKQIAGALNRGDA